MPAAGITLAETPVTLTDADRKCGYRFGVDGLVTIADAAKMLGNCSERTVERRLADGLFRCGREGGRCVICKRSLTDYIATLER